MTQISAADRVTIDFEPRRWRLIINGEYQAQVVAEANTGQPLRYISSFASTRRLPTGGALPVEHIRQVVLGWSDRDEAWHLGLVLGPELAEVRGSRWCEVARWPDPDTTLFAELAQEAGKALARTMARPFHLVPPRPEPDKPPPPRRELPLSFGLWTFRQDTTSGEYRLERSSRWTLAKLGRIAWYAFWAVVYIVLSVTTLTRGLALPNAGTMLPSPEVLPYLGLGAAVVLIGLVIYQTYRWLTEPDTIIVDPEASTITALRGGRERWWIAGQEVQSVYVTQVLSKDPRKSMIHHGEINLHLGAENFFFLVQHSQPEEPEQPRPNAAPTDDAVLSLTTAIAYTDLQHTGLYIADALGNLPCWYDQRVK